VTHHGRFKIVVGSKTAEEVCTDLRLAQSGGPTARFSVLLLLPEDGRRSSLRKVLILLKYRRWTKSKNTLKNCKFSLAVKGCRCEDKTG
jgi:hypothetical protein